jgi:sugar lactone lactonase YvrE
VVTAAEQFSRPVADLGEGPLWDERRQRLLSVDLLRGDVLAFDPDGTEHRTHISKVATVIRPRRSGFVVGVERGVQFVDEDLQPTGDPLPVFDTDGLRFNDGGCDPQGRLFIGSMAYDERDGAGTLYRLDPDGTVTTILDRVTVSNGIQWSADGSRVFYNDTPTGRVAVFDFDADDGSLHNGRVFATIPDGAGHPDGMAIDSEDGIWVALWGGSAVHRYDGAGKLSEVIELPVSKVTCPTFGGPDRRTLYVTTAAVDVSADDEPAAGAIFRVDPGVTGAIPYAFAG